MSRKKDNTIPITSAVNVDAHEVEDYVSDFLFDEEYGYPEEITITHMGSGHFNVFAEWWREEKNG